MLLDARRRVLALLSALLALGGCTAAIGGTATPAVNLPPLVPLRIGTQPAWGSDTVAVPGLESVQFGTDTAIVLGSATWPAADAAIAGVDLATGAVRWSYPDFGELAGGDGATYDAGSVARGDLARIVSVAGDPADQIVVASYLATACTDDTGLCPPSSQGVTDEQGIVALNLADGSVRWKTPLIPAVPSGSAEADTYRGREQLLIDAGADGIVVVVGDGTELLAIDASAADIIGTALLDPSTGTVRWEVPGTRGLRLAAGTVLAAVANGGPTIKNLGGLDVETGEQRWAFEASFPAETVWGVAGETALLLLQREQGPVVQELNTADGSPVGEATTTTATSCLDDRTSMIVCGPSVGDRTVQVWTAEPQPPATSAFGLPATAVLLQLVAEGTVFAGSGSATQAFDVHGRAVSDVLPATAVSMDDRYLALETTDGSGWAVYPFR